MEIYELTYEGILFKIKTEEEKKVFQKSDLEKGPGQMLTIFQFALHLLIVKGGQKSSNT